MATVMPEHLNFFVQQAANLCRVRRIQGLNPAQRKLWTQWCGGSNWKRNRRNGKCGDAFTASGKPESFSGRSLDADPIRRQFDQI